MRKIELLSLAGLFCFSVSLAVHASDRYEEFADSDEGRFHSILRLREKPQPDQYDSKMDSKKVAIYVDEGAWDLGTDHYKKLLQTMKASYRVLSAKDIIEGALTHAEFDLLMVPGGKSWLYLDSLGAAGQQAIREFVDQGGNYFGTCAGAFFAVSHRKDSKRDNIPYGIGLLEGTAWDGTALRTPGFKGGMIPVNYNMKDYKSRYQVLLLGGPAFIYSEEEAVKKNVQVLGTFPNFNKPAMITFNYGRGRVAIAGPHGEIEEKKAYMGLKWKDPDSEWPFLRKVLHWLRRSGDHPALR